MSITMNDVTPWYKQFWPWFLMALPATAVVGGIITIVIAMTNPDGLVQDDYYKAGLGINRTLEREQQALAERTAEPGFYQQDQAAINTALSRLSELAQELEAAYRRWSELES